MPRKPKGHKFSKLYWSHFIFAVLVCLLDSGFTHGYHLTCFRNVKAPVMEWFHSKGMKTKIGNATGSNAEGLELTYFGMTDACFSMGGTVGSCLIAIFANKFGRKGGMLMTAFISIFASLFSGYSKYFGYPFFIIVGRLLFGVKHGLNSGLGPMYLFEISPQEIRGQVAMLYGLAVSFGTIVGVSIGDSLCNRIHWPLVMSLPVIPAIIQLMLLPNCPESPKYLCVIKNNERECKRALKWFRGDGYKEEEIDKLRIESHQFRVIGEIRLGFILKNNILRNALVTSTVLTASQQLCGASMLLVYVQSHLLKKTSITYAEKHMKNVFNIVKTLASVLVFFVGEKCSRKSCFLVSFIGMAVTSFLLCLLFLLPPFFLIDNLIYIVAISYLIFYKFGTGGLSWFTPSEYFNTSAAPIGYAVGTGLVWLSKFSLIGFFLPVSKLLKGYSFVNYIVTNIALAYYTYSKVPETRNKTIKEVYRSLYLINNKPKTHNL